MDKELEASVNKLETFYSITLEGYHIPKEYNNSKNISTIEIIKNYYISKLLDYHSKYQSCKKIIKECKLEEYSYIEKKCIEGFIDEIEEEMNSNFYMYGNYSSKVKCCIFLEEEINYYKKKNPKIFAKNNKYL